VYDIRIVLKQNRAVVSYTGMPRRDNAAFLSALVVGSGTVIISVISCKAPVADFPQGTVILVVVRRLLIAFQAVREW
jgi:hypothetical protein